MTRRLRTAEPRRVGQSYSFAARQYASGTLSAASTGPGIFNKLFHLGGPATDIGIFDNTAASGGNWAIYLSGVSAGAQLEFNRPFDLGISVQLSAASSIGVSFVYE